MLVQSPFLFLATYHEIILPAAHAVARPPPTDPFSIPLSTFEEHLAINTTSAFAACQEALRSFRTIRDERIPRAYIYTGNGLNRRVVAGKITHGVGKAASAHFIEMAAMCYGESGYGFFYADERTPDGNAVYREIDGDAHADFYYGLATQPEPGDWYQTFVKGKGFVQFAR